MDAAPPGHQSLGRLIACFQQKYQASAASLGRQDYVPSRATRAAAEAETKISKTTPCKDSAGPGSRRPLAPENIGPPHFILGQKTRIRA
jgi:hypothetical protein